MNIKERLGQYIYRLKLTFEARRTIKSGTRNGFFQLVSCYTGLNKKFLNDSLINWLCNLRKLKGFEISSLLELLKGYPEIVTPVTIIDCCSSYITIYDKNEHTYHICFGEEVSCFSICKDEETFIGKNFYVLESRRFYEFLSPDKLILKEIILSSYGCNYIKLNYNERKKITTITVLSDSIHIEVQHQIQKKINEALIKHIINLTDNGNFDALPILLFLDENVKRNEEKCYIKIKICNINEEGDFDELSSILVRNWMIQKYSHTRQHGNNKFVLWKEYFDSCTLQEFTSKKRKTINVLGYI